MGGADRPPEARGTIAALAVTETVSWGVLYYAFAVVLTPMQAELGWPVAVLAAGFSLGLLVSGLLAPIVGAWIDRHGARRVMTGGSLLASAGVVAWAGVETPAAYYAVWVVLGAAMAATLYEPVVAAIGSYSRSERLRALLVVTTVAALASTVFSPLTEALGSRLGWRAALLWLAALLAVVTVPLHALALPTRRRIRVVEPDRATFTRMRRAWREADLRRVAVAFTAAKAVTVGVTVHLVAFLVLAGHSPAAAAGLAGVVGAGKVGGRLLVALTLRRVAAPRLGAAVIALQGVALSLVPLWRSPPAAVGLVALFGAAAGASTILRPAVMGDRFGSADYGQRNGIVALAERVTASVAPLLVGAAATATGSYTSAWVAMAALSLAASVLLATSAGPITSGPAMSGAR